MYNSYINNAKGEYKMKTLQTESNETKSHKVESDFPVLKRTYSYRKSVAIKAHDVRL